MAKLDLGLIFQTGYDRPVPKEMDRHIIKYVVGERIKAARADSSLLQFERWDHSDVFYAGRTHLNKLGWDTTVYNDNTIGGAQRRKRFYGMIQSICEDYYHVKRHQIGIFPEDRAVMAFNGNVYSVGFDDLRKLMDKGTDVLVVEKQGTVLKMVPFTRNVGIAFIQSQGFVSEYGTTLAQLCNKQGGIAVDYTDRWLPKYEGHLGNLTDCDSSGVMIGLKIKDATRIGIDLSTIIEMNKVNSDLGIDLNLKLEDLQESNAPNTHFAGLRGILARTGKLYNQLSVEETEFYQDYLSKYYRIDGERIAFIEYLANHRIELNTILAAAKPRAFWNWLRWKLLQVWPERDYRRGGIYLYDSMETPTFNEFQQWYAKQTESVIKDSVVKANDELANVEGFYEDVDGFEDNVNTRREEIETDIIDNILLQNEKIKEIDLGLEAIMKNEENDTITKELHGRGQL